MMSGKNFLNSINGNCENKAQINLSESRYKYGNKKLQKALKNRTGTKANKRGAAKRGKKCKNILGTKDPCRSPSALVRTLWPIVTLTRPRPSSLHSLRDVD